MSVRPVDFGMVQRLQDVSSIKQNEDSRPMIQQQNIGSQVAKEINQRSEQVIKKDDLRDGEEHYDAKDKSKGNYFGSNPHNKKESNKEKERVSIKGQKSFDIKI